MRRWLCAWLVLLLALQMVGAAISGLHGSWHRHRPALQSAAPSTPLVRWRHGEQTTRAGAPDAHVQMHAQGQLHDHAASDATVLPLHADSAADAVAQLGITLAPAADMPWPLREGARHERAVGTAWAAKRRSIAPPLKPPRG